MIYNRFIKKIRKSNNIKIFSIKISFSLVYRLKMSVRRNSSFPPQKVERLLLKYGKRNVKAENLPGKFIKFAKDIVHTLVEMPWRKLMLIVIMTFFTTWTFFGIVYYVIAWTHGDLVFDEVTGERMIGDRDPCIMEARTFAGFFLHSVESQVSTGRVKIIF